MRVDGCSYVAGAVALEGEADLPGGAARRIRADEQLPFLIEAHDRRTGFGLHCGWSGDVVFFGGRVESFRTVAALGVEMVMVTLDR